MKYISVSVPETNYHTIMTRRYFNKTFGKAEGKEILAGYLPNIVAVEITKEQKEKYDQS